MISKSVMRRFDCDCCKDYTAWISSIEEARAKGWCVCRDRRTCYCPSCAPRFRHVGSVGTPIVTAEDIFREKYGF